MPVPRYRNALHQHPVSTAHPPSSEHEILSEEAFSRRIALERKRTDRSLEPFLLMLVEYAGREKAENGAAVLDKALSALEPITRETDAIGWYRDRAVIGVLFTGIPEPAKQSSGAIIVNRVTSILSGELGGDRFSRTAITFHFYPDDWDSRDTNFPGNPTIYPDLLQPGVRKRLYLGMKRFIDVLTGTALLLASLPLFLIIAVAIKTTSRGPVFFRQQRVGQYGRYFTFLKFRSMYANSDSSVHREYVRNLIAGTAEPVAASGSGNAVYKLANDRRITPIGRLLRRTSMDELPQFLHVIRGDMSLVGPRPPLPYELAAYRSWHRSRLLQVKPGITGLWQVTGRSRVTFDDMVRLDLRYAKDWTPWLDIKILLRTPGAVLKGAY